ncbi:Imm40 family immunity protein [Aerococcaceae bacterium NML130460]|nr:Imm40 family immunity protein [Aerococcaceae bacterium NML171108]MCW6680073.1 Imm40 family immunity protein [Aerococcaceae bacterium NML130460]
MNWEQFLPRELMNKAYSLYQQFGIREYAWTYEDLLTICSIIEERKLIIHGGDVYSNTNGTVQLTYDNWWYEGDSSHDSILHTLEYIRHYIERNGVDFLFVLVLSNNELSK